MNSSKRVLFGSALFLASILTCLLTSEAAVTPMSESFEGATLGTSVMIDSNPGTDVGGTAGAMPLPGTIFDLMQVGGATPGTGQSTVTVVNDGSATHGNTTSNSSLYVQMDVAGATGGSLGSALYTAFSGSADGEAYIMKVDIYNPNDATPRLAASSDISPSFSNFGWHSTTTTHSRMYDLDPNSDWQSWWMVVNDNVYDIDYTDPNGGNATVAAGTAVRWIDGVMDTNDEGSINLANNAELMGFATSVSNSGGPALTFYADNFSIDDISDPAPTLTIDRDTGEMVLSNNTSSPIQFLGYSITSDGGALDPVAWKSVTENYDGDSGSGPTQIDTDDNWTILSASDSYTDFSEFQFGGPGPNDGATLGVGQSISLGVGAWHNTYNEVVAATYIKPDGGLRKADTVFVGNSGMGFEQGDLDFDNDIDIDDYIAFLSGLHTDLSALSPTEAYKKGDMNGDLANNFDDTVIFRDVYDAANGAGAFAALVAGVPEPASMTLLGLGFVALLLGRRRRAHGVISAVAAIACLLLFVPEGNRCFAQTTIGSTYMIDVNDADNSETAAGWSGLDSPHTGSGGSLILDGIEFSTFSADGARLRTSGSGETPIDVNKDFVFDDGSNAAVGIVFGEAGDFIAGLWSMDVYIYDWGVSGADTMFHYVAYRDGSGEHILADDVLPNATGAAYSSTFKSNGVSSYDMFVRENNAANRSRLNGIVLTYLGPTVSLQINQTTGKMQIFGANDSSDLNYYEITSESGALDPSGWNSLDDQNIDAVDGDDGGTDAGDSPGEGWDKAGGVSANILSEIFLSGSTLLDEKGALALGGALGDSGDLNDIKFRFAEVGDTVLTEGGVQFFESGDMNGDGAVDEDDVNPFVQALTNRAAFQAAHSDVDADFVGDFNGNNQLDLGDVAGFKAAVAALGAASAGAVPEPSTVLLLGLALVGWTGYFRSRRRLSQ